MSERGGSGWQNPSWNEPVDGRPAPQSGGPYSGGPQRGYGPPHPGPGQPTAPRPGVVPLRPLAFGEVLDGAIGAVRRQPLLTLGLSAAVVTLQQVLVLLGTRAAHLPVAVGFRQFTNPSAAAGNSPFARASLGGYIGFATSQLVAAVVSLILIGVLVVVIGESVLGRRSTFAAVWAQSRGQLWRLAVGAVIGGLLPWLPAIVGGAAVGALVGIATVGAGIAIGALVFLALLAFPGAYFWGAMTILPPALMLERLGPIQAVRRSITLVRNDFWRVWGIRAVTVLITGVISGVVTVPFATIGGVVAGDNTSSLLAGAISAVGAIIVGSAVTPFTAGVYTLLYVDRRMRAEGWDIELAEAARAGKSMSAMVGTDSGTSAGSPTR